MINFLYYIHNQSKRDIKFHYHKYYEFSYYKSGSGYSEYVKSDNSKTITSDITSTYVDVSNKKYNKLYFQENSLIIYPPYVAHNKKHLTHPDIYAFVFEIVDDDLQFDCQAIKSISYKTKKLIELLIEEHESQKYKYKNMMGSILNELCINLKREIEQSNTKEKDNQIKEMVYYIDDYFLANIDIASLAKQAGYSLDRFRHLFKKEAGYSPKQYILNLKMEYAKSQIINTDIKISTIAVSCGYDDLSKFSNYFRKKYGKYPNQLRKEGAE